MSKMSQMAQTIEELRSAAATIAEAADWLAGQFSAQVEQPAAETPTKTKPAVTLEQVRAVLADKSRAGHTAAVLALLEKHGATKLSQVDPQHYEAILKEAEGFADAT